jgi:hypothetical protein
MQCCRVTHSSQRLLLRASLRLASFGGRNPLSEVVRANQQPCAGTDVAAYTVASLKHEVHGALAPARVDR